MSNQIVCDGNASCWCPLCVNAGGYKQRLLEEEWDLILDEAEEQLFEDFHGITREEWESGGF